MQGTAVRNNEDLTRESEGDDVDVEDVLVADATGATGLRNREPDTVGGADEGEEPDTVGGDDDDDEEDTVGGEDE